MTGKARIEALLETILPDNVWFNPPTGLEMTYPAIIFGLDTVETVHADNRPYKSSKVYEVIIIDPDVNGTYADQVSQLPTASHVRSYIADGLQHDIYTLY